MGDGTVQNPFTREDVLRLIEENGGRAEGLDLSEKVFVEQIDLSDLDLSGIKLTNLRLFRANFTGSNLERATMQKASLGYATFNPLNSKGASLKGVDLRWANLHDAEFRGADLTVAQFQETPVQAVVHPPEPQSKLLELLPASLERTDLRGANLFLANFKGCYFYGTKLEGAFIRGANIYEAHLEDADWGNYKIGEESKKEELHFAESIYRRLKQWYTEHGMYDIAGKFFYREMEAKRKAQSWKKNPDSKLWSWVIRLLCGYGERYGNVVVAALVIIFGLAVVYVYGGLNLAYAIYFSAVSFTALGYGSWVNITPEGWVQALGAVESFLGVFMMALFLVTFIRKMTR
ncbi:pentapeptide repeat-containing protein [Chloroflexota bacterium]